MRPISERIKRIIDTDPFYKKCARGNHECSGRITMEHALIYAGRQVDEVWAIVPICEFHHAVGPFQDGGDLQKEVNVWIALNRATDSELMLYSKAVNYVRERERLTEKYGEYKA